MPESPAEPGNPPGPAPAPGGAPAGGASAPGGASVGGLQRAMAAGTLTSAGITAFYLERIHRLNPALHAVITVSPDATAEARASDKTRADGAPAARWRGFPSWSRTISRPRACPPPRARPRC